ncbi:2OG-Fe(II) oxygenase [Gynuella sunshinyii]|uniref:Putative proline hydroxylase n=1 Tax=Gynuella sunshinyii YC6258 TaxID=1445510 RepID=A0A0C5VQS3_9GAMM|nr:2OG-Fe(II) oxygenase [Gynuella sunshinyii]AJQ96962.1 putative proline hydroxylase [Gynuella sunshinyii YC6258]
MSPVRQLFSDNFNSDDAVFRQIADGLTRQGYCVIPGALPEDISDALLSEIITDGTGHFKAAGVGRQDDYLQSHFIRRDNIHWIDGRTAAEQLWLQWTQKLQTFLNRELFLGLFSFETHWAHYQPGSFYKKHCDAFRGEANRIVTVIGYLNPGWTVEDGGDLVIYREDSDDILTKVMPAFGTLVVFMSEEFPHEVQIAHKHRYSVTGWFRLNSSTEYKVDPPK